MSYRNISNWAARIFRQTKHLGGKIDILSLFGCLRQTISYGSSGLITLWFGLLLLSACAGLPVRGSVGMQAIDTRVDSEAARYYLGSYLAGQRSDVALDERIDRSTKAPMVVCPTATN